MSFITILSCIHHFGTLLQNGGLVKSTEMICKQGGDHIVRLLMCVCCLCTVRSTIAIKMFFLYCYSASKMIIGLYGSSVFCNDFWPVITCMLMALLALLMTLKKTILPAVPPFLRLDCPQYLFSPQNHCVPTAGFQAYEK